MHLMWRKEIAASVHTLYTEKSVIGTCRFEEFPIQVGFE